MFKREDDKTVFEPPIMTKVKSIVDKIVATPGYGDFCMRTTPKAKAISAIDLAADTITIRPGDETLTAGTVMQLSDHSGTSGPAIAAGAIASIDAGDANTLTLNTVESIARESTRQSAVACDLQVVADRLLVGTGQASPDEQIAAGQKLRIASKAGQTCAVLPLDTDLVVGSIDANHVITFDTPLRLGDASAAANCIVTRAVSSHTQSAVAVM
jgi:hypothetical protein